MSATDELRSLLDIHGLRWSNYGERETRWYGTLDGIEWSEWAAVEYGPYLHVTCGDCGELLSPAEIVAVSVAYSSICTGGERTSDERGTCHEVRIDRFWRGCSECGFNWEILHSVVGGSRPNYCPKCGAKVVDE